MRKTAWFCGALALTAALAVSPALSHDADKHQRHLMMDGERIDLSDLQDGETRTFGAGEREITATREGDLIHIAMGDQERVHELTCTAGQDGCFVIQAGEGGAMKLLVTKSDDDRHTKREITVMALGDGALHGDHELFFADENGENVFVSTHGEGHWVSDDAGDVRVVVAGAEDAPFGIHLGGATGTTLRCPEGDTTMRLKEGEEDEGPYFCPRHEVRLEKVETHRLHTRTLHVHAGDDD